MTRSFLIVEDHPLFAEVLQYAIQDHLVGSHFEHAGSIAEARHTYKGSAFDLVLVGLSLPDNYGFSGIIELRRQRPKVPIIIISAFDDHKVIQYAMACGVSGFISKAEEKRAIVSSIEYVLLGGTALPESFLQSEMVLDAGTKKSNCKLSGLTLQELRVLHMLCQGMLNKQVSHELQVSEATVKAHVSKILSKLKVSSRTQAVIEASKFCFSPVPAFYAHSNAISDDYTNAHKH